MKKILVLAFALYGSCSAYLVPVGPEIYGLVPMMEHNSAEIEQWREDNLYNLCVMLYEEYEDLDVLRLVISNYARTRIAINVEYRLNRAGIPV